jgi:hypothetical protein
MAKIEIGGLSFPSKTAAVEYFKATLHRHSIGARVPDPDNTELGWLLERHPNYQDKAGCGVQHFSVRDAIYGTRCFEIVRTDGSKTDFSYITCLNGKAPSPESEALGALRAEVASDILDKKREFFQERGDNQGMVPCAITGVPVTFEGSHADHAPPRPFGTLALTFLKARGITPSAELITPSADNQYEPRLRDRALAEAWRTYHHDLAVIRVVAKGANLAHSHEGKVKKKDAQLKFRPSTA